MDCTSNPKEMLYAFRQAHTATDAVLDATLDQELGKSEQGDEEPLWALPCMMLLHLTSLWIEGPSK